MTLATILILSGVVCLVAAVALPVSYGLRLRLAGRRHVPARARLVGATGVVSGMGSR